MSSNRAVRGYIFQCKKTGRYFLEPGKGEVHLKQFAYVYTAKEARAAANTNFGWGGKKEGKWYIVYE